MDYFDEPIQIEPWIPFKEGDKVYTDRMPIYQHPIAVDRLFDTKLGGFDPTSNEHVSLRRFLKALAVVGDSYCYLDAETAKTTFIDTGVAQSVPTSFETFDVHSPELAALHLVLEMGQADRKELSFKPGLAEDELSDEEGLPFKLGLAEDVLSDALDGLRNRGLLVCKTDGKFALTKEGLLSWAQSTHDSDPIEGVEKMEEITQHWQESLIAVHSLEKDHMIDNILD